MLNVLYVKRVTHIFQQMRWVGEHANDLFIYRRTRENCLRRTCRPNFYRVTLYAMYSRYIIFLTRHISETARDRHIQYLYVGTKSRKLRLLSNGTIFNDIGWPTHKYTKLLSREIMLARYRLCTGPVLVRPSVRQRDRATPSRAEGPASRRRRTCGLLLQTRSSGVVGPSMRPIATDAQQ